MVGLVIYRETRRNLLGRHFFSFLTVTAIIRLYMFVQTQEATLKGVNFSVCKLFIHKSDFNKVDLHFGPQFSTALENNMLSEKGKGKIQ